MEIVVIKHYMNAAEAYIDAGLLKSNGIECQVNGGTLPNIALPSIVEQVTLVVRADSVVAAKELLDIA